MRPKMPRKRLAAGTSRMRIAWRSAELPEVLEAAAFW